MPRAVLKNGVICPLEPLPPEWTEGQELWVEAADESEDESPEALDRWYQELEALVAQNDPEDLARIEAALKEADELAKAQVRREMEAS